MRAEAGAVRRESYEGKGAAGRFYLGDTPLVLEELLRQYAGQVKAVYMDPPFLTGDRFVMRARVGAADWKACLLYTSRKGAATAWPAPARQAHTARRRTARWC